MDLYRRGACDRCRRQKLRCVRTTKEGDHLADNRASLDACQRCVRAGIDCVTTLPQPRRLPRAERLSDLSSSSGTALQPLYPKQTAPYIPGSPGLAFTRNIHDASFNQTALMFDSAPAVHQSLSGVCQRGDERPLKRRSKVNEPCQSPQTKSPEALRGVERSPISKSYPPNQFDLGIRACQQNDHNYRHEDPTSLVSVLFPSEHEFTSPTLRDKTMTDTISRDVLGQATGHSLHRLTDLSSKLSRELSNISTLKLEEILSFSSGDSPRYTNNQAATYPKNLIGRVLDSSQTFLDILEELPTHSSRDSSAGSECSYFEYLDDTDFPATNSSEFVVHNTATGAGPRTSFSSNRAETQGNGDTVDMPTILTILTCYTWLSQAYTVIFSQIYSALLTHVDMPTHPLPPVLPGLYLGGFSLDEHHDLQIETFIHLATAMLDRMGQKLGLQEDYSRPANDVASDKDQGAALCVTGGIVGTASASALLEVLSRNDGSGKHSNGSEGARATDVKQIMKNIRVMLKDCQIRRSVG